MSRYVVAIIGPSGMQTYLARGREVASEEHATHYPHPSNAEQAASAYRAKASGVFTWQAVDTRSDPEPSACGNGGW